jgi:hypothetical protein
VIKRREKILRAYYVHRWSARQIAEVLSIPEGTVENDLRAIRAYGQKIGDQAMQVPLENTIFELQTAYNERQSLRWQQFHNETDIWDRKDPVNPKLIHKADNRLRAQLLNNIAEEEREFIKVMQTLGGVHKEPDKLQVEESWADIAGDVPDEEETET